MDSYRYNNYSNEMQGYDQPSYLVHQVTRPPQIDAAAVTVAAEKLKTITFVGGILGLLTLVSGAATLGLAGENIGFPTFNFGPLLVGIIFGAGNLIGFFRMRVILSREITSENISDARCMVILVFVISTVCVTLAIISGVFALISGAVCVGADIEFSVRTGYYSRNIDVRQSCHPYDTANAVLAFVDGVLCLLIAVWCIFGCCFFCSYGRYFGIKTRRRR